MKKILLFIIAVMASATSVAQIQLEGVVKNDQQIPVNGALLKIEGTTLSCFSSADGHFYFSKMKPGNYILSVNFLGYEDYFQSLQINKDTSVTIHLVAHTFLANEVTVTAIRADKNSGVAYSELNKNEIEKLNLGQDVPYILQQLPSVVTTSDAGTGIGYTGIRIRGSDASRTNVTINGIPLNDAESQQVYWVDLPDFASSAENIQVQRGVGTSTNEAGAFGGSVNILTSDISSIPFATSSNSFGSFNTIKNNINIGTGLLYNHFSFEGRASRIVSDGYIDRGSSDLKSYYAAGSYSSKNTIVRLNMFSGNEVTYQCWNGVPESRIKGDRQGMLDYINRNGLDEADANNLLNSGRNYNMFTYGNQTDNYKQSHYQLLFSHQLNKKLLANVALHYTHGEGYYEEYQPGQLLSDYSIQPTIIGTDTISTSDLIRRKWLNNNFYGTTYSLQYNDNSYWKIIFGGAWNKYDGGHYGEVIWAQFAGNSDIRHRYYDYDAHKTDFTNYAKAEYSFSKKLIAFADLQIRNVIYSFNGIGSNGQASPQSVNLLFFNPKYGVTYQLNKANQLFASAGVGHKEANSDDYTQSTPSSRPKAESMIDYEFGYKLIKNKFKLDITSYYMNYTDQLVLTGQINDVGNYTHTNIKNSYRAGIEIESSIAITNKIKLLMNATLSDNRIKTFTEYTDNYDTGGQDTIVYKNKSIAFSPSVIAMAGVNFNLSKNFELQLNAKYIGKQYLDNTQREDRKIDSYLVCDARMSYVIYSKLAKEIRFNILFNNLLNTLYSSNGYTYGYIYNQSRTQENFYYPQAGLNVLGQVTVKF